MPGISQVARALRMRLIQAAAEVFCCVREDPRWSDASILQYHLTAGFRIPAP